MVSSVRARVAYELGGKVVASSDVVDGLAGFDELEDPLGRHAAHLWHAEAPERVDHDGGVWARRPPAHYGIGFELDPANEPLGHIGQHELLTGPNHDRECGVEAHLLLNT